ncbi:TPA: histidine phosphatase family protein [Candidatus Micrarchaeota archaeon]|nr:histidine phosphatase family protein [Candidatus Micrarchaeota archaeon]
MVERIFLVRHAETVGNTLGLFQGFTDSALTPLGVEQAKQLGSALSQEKFDLIYSSPLGRVKQTLEQSGLAKNGTRIIHADELRERNYGEMQNKAKGAIPESESAFETDALARPAGGESVDDLKNRFMPLFKTILESKEESVLVLTHFTPVLVALNFFTGLPIEKWRLFKCHNASIAEVVRDEGLWRIMRANDTCHLK